jgi:prolyl 4-hydroxylase
VTRTEPGSAADVAHDMAIKLAEGLGVPQDWNAALDHLQQSAELGSPLAKAELAGLAGEWPMAHAILAGSPGPSASAWSGFRNAINLAPWFEVEQHSTISAEPFIAGIKKFVAAETCDWIMSRARTRLNPARIYDQELGAQRISATRTNSVAPFRTSERDLVQSLLRARIAALTGLPLQSFESPHILHYLVGQEFQPHYDTSDDPNAPGFRRRVMTFLVALNDDYEGGETAFLAVKGRWKGRKGGALFFSNVGTDGKLDKRTLHAGLPVTSGEKWIFSQWIEG